jgi:phage terminase large subunit-like protein
MPWREPEYKGEFPSLGWALADLIEEYMVAPSGLHYGQPFRLTDRQLEFLVRMHRIDPVTGRFFYRRAVKEGPKGDGKSPLAGAMAFAHLVGPVVFDGWDADGEPVGRQHPTPWIQIAAVAEDQTDNCYMQLRAALGESKAIDEFGIDFGLTRVYLKGREGKIEPVTSVGGTREGQPITFAVKEETHGWVPNRGGDRLSRTLDRNLAKTGGLSVAVTNTYRIGEESVAETEAAAARKKVAGLLYDAVRGPMVEDLSDRDLVRRSLAKAYDPEAVWLDMERLAEEVGDESIPPGERRRFYFNIPDKFDAESWLPAGAWDKCLSDETIPDGAEVSIGIDVALYNDDTAVVVVWLNPDTGRYVVRARMWEPPKTGGGIEITDVMAHIRDLSFKYKFREALYDPRFFDVPARMLEDEGIPMVEFPQSADRMVPACGFAYEQILAGNVAHDGDPELAIHIVSAERRIAERGWTLSKSKAAKTAGLKIDGCIAMVIGMWSWNIPAEPVHEPAVFFV